MDSSDSAHLLAATAEFYNAHPDLEHGRLKAHRIEFEVTLRTILKYLPRVGAKVLDVGGGTGKHLFSSVTRYDANSKAVLNHQVYILMLCLRETTV